MKKIIPTVNQSMLMSLSSNVTGQFLMYLGVILLARTFNPAEFGEFRYLFNVCTIVNLVVLLGRDAFMMKERQAHDKINDGYANEFFSGFTNIYVVLFFSVSGIFILEYTGFSGDLEKYLVCILMVSLWSLANLIIAVLKVESKILTTQFLSNFVQRFLRFLFFISVFLYFKDKIISAYYAMLLSQVIFVMILIACLNPSTIRLLINTSLRTFDYWKNFQEGVSLFSTTIVIVLALKIDILVLGLISDWEKVAIYEIVLMIGMVVLLPQMASHKITEIKYINSEHNNNLRTDAVNKAVMYSIIPMTLIIVFSNQILNVFGSNYISGSGVLIVLSLGYFITTFLGSPFETMMMNGYAKISTRILSIQILVTTILIITLFDILDLYGVTLAIISSLVMGKIIARKYCERLGLFVNKINYKLLFISLVPLCISGLMTLMV